MKTVLIIDDNEIDRFLHRKILERVKQIKEIHTVSNGPEAIALLNSYFQRSKSLPQIILLDLNMPVMDGFTFVDTFKQLPVLGKEHVTIIIVTSSDNQSDVAKAREMGIDLFLVKPLTEEKILAKLE
jgi:CheY-like chemotaxis protein